MTSIETNKLKVRLCIRLYTPRSFLFNSEDIKWESNIDRNPHHPIRAHREEHSECYIHMILIRMLDDLYT